MSVHFFRTASGGEPVREWLLSLSKEDRSAIGKDIKTAEYGWPVGMPICRSMGDGLWEVRSNLESDRIARFLFKNKELILISGFIKKSQKTPKPELDLAKIENVRLKMTNKHIGSSFDDFLEEEGILAETNAVAIKRVVAWQIQQKIENEHLSKTKMAQLMKTSRSGLDRLLDPSNTSVTLHTLDNAAKALGKKLKLELI